MTKLRSNLPVYSASGNRFILASSDDGALTPLRIRELCSQRNVDGVILVIPAGRAHYTMRIFNADGSEAEMCGNGLRCLGAYVSHRWGPSSCKVEAIGGKYELVVEGNEVAVAVDAAGFIVEHREIPCRGDLLALSSVNTGVPHAVHLIENRENWEHFPFLEAAQSIRYHTEFAPAGTNFSIAMNGGGGKVWIRTYERGVEAETGSCGTGALALVASLRDLRVVLENYEIIPTSGEPITITCKEGERWWMRGPVFSCV